MLSVKCSTMAILVVLEGVSIVGAKIVITANVLTHVLPYLVQCIDSDILNRRNYKYDDDDDDKK